MSIQTLHKNRFDQLSKPANCFLRKQLKTLRNTTDHCREHAFSEITVKCYVPFKMMFYNKVMWLFFSPKKVFAKKIK